MHYFFRILNLKFDLFLFDFFFKNIFLMDKIFQIKMPRINI